MKKFLLFLLLFLLVPFKVFASAPEIDSLNAVLINVNDGSVIYEKSKDEVIKVASMQKVLTTIVALENIENLDDRVEIKYGMFSSLDSDLMRIGLQGGDTPTYRDLIYGTMLKSGADSAYALAVNVAGSEENFVDLMNKKAKKLGLKDTVIKNVTGQDQDGQYSTVNDVSILMKYAYNNKEFREIISKTDYNILGKYEFSGPLKKAKLYGMDYVLGMKTGTTDEAGLCLVSYAKHDNIEFILVTARAPEAKKDQNFLDQKAIYDYYINNYSYMTLVDKDDLITTVKTKYLDEIPIKAKKDVVKYLDNSIFVKDLVIEYDGEEVINKDLKKGDKIGKYIIKYNDDILYEEDVILDRDISFFNSRLFFIILIIISSIILLLIIIRSIIKLFK